MLSHDTFLKLQHFEQLTQAHPNYMGHEQIAVAHVAANPDNDGVVDSTNHCLCRPVCLNGSPRLVVELVTGSA